MRLLIAAFLCFYAATVWAGEYAVEVYVVEKIPSTETEAIPFSYVARDGDKKVEEWIRKATLVAKFPRLKDGQAAKYVIDPVIKNYPEEQKTLNPIKIEFGKSVSVKIHELADSKIEGEIAYDDMTLQKDGAAAEKIWNTQVRTVGETMVVGVENSSDKKCHDILIYKVTKL